VGGRRRRGRQLGDNKTNRRSAERKAAIFVGTAAALHAQRHGGAVLRLRAPRRCCVLRLACCLFCLFAARWCGAATRCVTDACVASGDRYLFAAGWSLALRERFAAPSVLGGRVRTLF